MQDIEKLALRILGYGTIQVYTSNRKSSKKEFGDICMYLGSHNQDYICIDYRDGRKYNLSHFDAYILSHLPDTLFVF